jgi:hypothetical protein
VYSLLLNCFFAYLWVVLFEPSVGKVIRIVFGALYPIFIFIFSLLIYPILTPVRYFEKKILVPIKLALIDLIKTENSKRIFKIKKSEFIKKTEHMLKNV